MRMILALLLAIVWAGPAIAEKFTPINCETARDDQTCMACNIYHEARGEVDAGQIMVALVTSYRTHDRRWPDSICEVTWQRRWVERDNFQGYVAQFSWTWDGESDMVHEEQAWDTAWNIAGLVLEAHNSRDWQIRIDGIYCDPLWYHNPTVSPRWATRLYEVGRVGDHIFYCDPDMVADSN